MTERRISAVEGWAKRMGVPAPTEEALKASGGSIAASIPNSPSYIPREVLSEREEEVLQLRFGSPDGLSRTQRQVGKALGCSHWTVGRLERRAIANLREFMQQNSP